MSAVDELYCKIFVNTDADRRSLVQRIATIVGGSASKETIDSPDVSVDVEENEDFDGVRLATRDGFLFFRYYLDVFPAAAVERASYVATIGRLLCALRAGGIGVVPACDFEDELPQVSRPTGEH